MGTFLGYMIFSTFDGLAVYAFILYIFRVDLMKFIGPILLMITATNVQSFIIRDELALTAISPIFNIILTILFLAIFIRIPFIWAIVMTVTGYTAYVLLQTLIILLSDDYMSIDQIQEFVWRGYLLQCITGIVGVAIGWLLYKMGYGFSFEFEKLRLKWERVFIILFLLCFLSVLCVIMYFKVVFTNLIVLAVALFIFLTYAFRKEESKW
ncbi:hypothetical protein [Cohnella phaseoli]|uniref:Uncharacterized protein n=1 Tax=Cohnella phaseoli TaxID=456490 RepID=A0A3D9JMY6_9BACL|nr:hypothetical protein [Cohnella phaseoli]RED75388.1 hypothetical protein DFP98_1153 [Cohnella phaseoli]